MLRYFLFVILFAPLAEAAPPDPLTGVRISLVGLQTMLASPPLPSLDNKNFGEMTIQAAYVRAQVNDNYLVPATSGSGLDTERVKGSFKGYALGLGLTSSARKDFGLFAFGMYNSVNGDIRIAVDQFPNAINLSGMKNTGLSAAAGVSWRFLGPGAGSFNAGLFGGPTISKFTSRFSVATENSTATPVAYSASPSTFGGMAGVQADLRLAMLYLNPYFIYYRDLTSGCKAYSPGGTTPNADCSGLKNALHLPLSFSAFGVNLGVYNLFISVYTHIDNDDSLKTIDLTKYQLSYVIKF